MIALTEASVWSFIKNSVASILGKRRMTNVKKDDSGEQKINQEASVSRRLTPKPSATIREKLGYKPIRK